MGYSYPAIK